jgi:hypothetical protein
MAPLRRIFVVIIAFVSACAAASIVFIISIASAALIPSFLWAPPELIFLSAHLRNAATFLFTAFIMTLRIAYLPALAVVVFAEVRQLRLWTYYSVCGLRIGVWCNIILVYDDVRNTLSFGAFVNDSLLVFIPYAAFSGAVAGLCYWWMAGRHAGTWRDVDPVDISPRREGV